MLALQRKLGSGVPQSLGFLLGKQFASSLSPQNQPSAVPCIGVGTEEFKAWSRDMKNPAVLRGGLTRYNLSQHSLDALQLSHGNHVVPVEVSTGGADYRAAFSSETQPGRVFQQDVEVPLALLLNLIRERDGERPPHQAEGRDSLTLLYLAQKDVHSLLPHLALDPAHLPLKIAGDRLFQQSIWLGPRGTTTPLHCDPYCNLLCQVWGRKQVRIYDAEQRERLFPYPQGPLRNTSQVSCSAVDAAKFPGFQEIEYSECVVEPGDILFLPKKFWHEVIALTGSLSLSFWWT